MRNGPMTEDISMVDASNNIKRKVRESMSRPDYADAESSDDDDLPLVCAKYDRIRST